LPNKACTGRWGFCGIFKHFSGFGFFLLPNIIHARPSASNASRWAIIQPGGSGAKNKQRSGKVKQQKLDKWLDVIQSGDEFLQWCG